MDNKLIEAFFTAYPLDSIPMDVLMIIGLIYFLKLPKEKKTNIHFWLPFLILIFTFFYENFGKYTNYNYEFKKSVNEYFGNFKYPKFNLWLFNVAKRQVGTILYLLLIKSWLEPSKKKYINWMIYLFIIVASFLQFTGIEPIYLNQPIIFAIGANMILIGSALYFTGMITHPQYLDKNPLKLLSFWQMTFVMFTFTLTYISSVSLIYLYEADPVLGAALQQIDIVMKNINLGILTLTIASPFLPGFFEEEPFYVSHKTPA
ncbi:histidine kinase [Algoriphagus lutimaris]|uniref:histidine kinase n=1 Tax=Algoriphagus lutimaris TaxID=613197 RepID=UPI00196B3E8C|nr:histidine kinase [Algoriphagus lutimaris]MBN3520804.1 histidine kinase [Algoriphagus lutimaris]